MMILFFKLIASPILILCLTLLSRRYGPTLGGLLMGVPLVTGPISVFTAFENGEGFAQHAAVANFVGQISTCLFCFCYAVLARRLNCGLTALASITTFFAATLLWNQFAWAFLPALGALLATIILLMSLLKPANVDAAVRVVPRFDLPVRMVISAAFVLLITLLTRHLGPQLSGLIAPFPVFVLILSVFTHYQMGAGAAANLTRGVIVGSFAFAAFFAVVAAGLTQLGIAATYALATLASVVVSGLSYLLLHWKLQQTVKRQMKL
jgi:uncharacterized membrane protein (GlpM family)